MWNIRFNNTQSAVCDVLVFILICVVVASAKDFGYGGQHGPQNWAKDNKLCSGKHQSPINIDTLHVIKMQYSDINYFNFDIKPKAVLATNNGHTILVTMNFEKGKEPRMNGGPLDTNNTDYQFEQFHFHWGENDTVGSEDMINNQRYPVEMHVVMRNLNFKDLSSALGQEHGIAVLAFFFKASGRKYNPFYGEFVEMISSLDRKGKSEDLVESLPLMKFLSTNSMNYYSYIGSLTTPPCTEKVIWIDYQKPIALADYQLDLFRQLMDNDEHLKNNFRPIQPLNDRIIYENIPNPQMINKSWTSLRNAANFTVSKSAAVLLCVSLVILLKGTILAAFN